MEHPTDDVTRQLLREKSQRDAAQGRRAKAVMGGDLGPVLRRWVSGSIMPVSERLQAVSRAVLAGDLDQAATLTSSPLFGLSTVSRSADLEVLLKWTLKRPEIADDMVLTVMGSTVTTLSASSSKPVPLTRVIASAAGLARETAMGQFLTQVQGAKTMLKVRERHPQAWAQRNQMDAVGAIMAGQVRSALAGRTPAEIPVRGKSVVTVLTPKGERRRIDLWPPEENDWKVLDLARRAVGQKDAHLVTWCSYVMLILCCAQADAGWFDLSDVAPGETLRRGQHRRKAKGLVLSDGAYNSIMGDLDRWLHLGFIKEPMVSAPECGDYLSVKHRPVAGGRGPMGIKTDAKGTAAWEVASEVMAKTPWQIAKGTLRAIEDSDFIRGLAVVAEPDEGKRLTILTQAKQLAAEDAIYMPIFMDFRGRVYTQPNMVTYQGGDLQKSLLQFPVQPSHLSEGADWGESFKRDNAIILHLSNLYGNGLDKAHLSRREAWVNETLMFAGLAAVRGDWEDNHLGAILEKADEPLQLLTALAQARSGRSSVMDQMACQIDGTCNGLQHLSALFRDETAAPWVNLCEAGYDEAPKDIYGEVARRAAGRLQWHVDGIGGAWASRVKANVKIDRKLCKKAVMVLPYGGTRGTIEEAIQSGMLAQNLRSEDWVQCLDYTPRRNTAGQLVAIGAMRDHEAVSNGYLAFQDRDLKDHPLFHKDAQRLAGIVWEVITELLPKPMAAMQTFRDIAKAVGERTVEWSTGYGQPMGPLWVVQAKAKSSRSTLKFKGLQLPGSVRGLSIRPGRDEIDPTAHVSGIVANFIHSQDASHLARTMARFDRRSFGAIHDCFITRPSLMGRLGVATREAFEAQYDADPLAQAVVVRSLDGKDVDAYPSWYALAEAVGAKFPEKGLWRPREVTRSAWFFS